MPAADDLKSFLTVVPFRKIRLINLYATVMAVFFILLTTKIPSNLEWSTLAYF